LLRTASFCAKTESLTSIREGNTRGVVWIGTFWEVSFRWRRWKVSDNFTLKNRKWC
jgi:hypothetical protein